LKVILARTSRRVDGEDVGGPVTTDATKVIVVGSHVSEQASALLLFRVEAEAEF
jgi:hypothetical protein